MISNFAALAVIAAGFFFILSRPVTQAPVAQQVAATSTQTAAAVEPILTATSTPSTNSGQAATSTLPIKHATTTTPVAKKAPVATPVATTTPQSPNTITRIQNPYSFAPLSADAINTAARSALVNILCMPRGGSLSPVSGSGVLIDPRGIILTNAHVAQYVLLSEDANVNLSCTIRTGAPATARYIPQVLYMPPAWVDAHVSELFDPHPAGTGEHDYALLMITDSADNSPLPATFPYLNPDTRSAVAFQGDNVLVASYPAEFLGGIAAEYNLFPASSVTTIGKLLTFSTGAPDVLSLGGIIEAQSGSSGGAVVNAWGQLVGLIVTTSEGTTTADRDLHALALSYISTDLAAQSGSSLTATLDGNVGLELQQFTTDTAPRLLRLYLQEIAQH